MSIQDNITHGLLQYLRAFMLGAHYLSAKLVHYLSGFMLRDLGVHNEADRIFR